MKAVHTGIVPAWLQAAATVREPESQTGENSKTDAGKLDAWLKSVKGCEDVKGCKEWTAEQWYANGGALCFPGLTIKMFFHKAYTAFRDSK